MQNPNTKPSRKLSDIIPENTAVQCTTLEQYNTLIRLGNDEGYTDTWRKEPLKVLTNLPIWGPFTCLIVYPSKKEIGVQGTEYVNRKLIPIVSFQSLFGEVETESTPVSNKAQKTKRIPFDLEKYKAGAKAVCRVPEDWTFKRIIAEDLEGYQALVAVVNDGNKDMPVQLKLDGMAYEDESDYDILLEVPDDSPTVHELKIWPKYYEAVDSGKKRFEIRKDDRNYQVGDILELRYFYAAQGLYDEKKPVIKAEIIYILNGGQFGLEPGYVAIGFNRIFPQ